MADPATSSGRQPVQIPPAEIPSLKTLLSLAVFVVIVAGLYLGREVLIPVTLAVLMSFILAPLATLLRRLRLGKVPAVFIAIALALGMVLALGGVIGTQLAELAQDAPRYQATIQNKIDTVRSAVLQRISDLTGRFKPTSPAAEKATEQKPSEGTKKLMAVEVHQPDPTPLQIAESILAPAVSPLTTLGVVFIVSIFVLLQREDLRNRLIRLFGSRDLHRTTVAMDEAATRLSHYFLTQLAINGSFGLVIGAGLYFIGVPSPILWGLIATLLRFVPYVGAVLSAVGPLALAAAAQPGWSPLLWTAGLFAAVEFIMGQVVEPLIYGHATGLSPISVIVAAIFWTWLWGPIGLVLSTPLTMCLVVLGRHAERLEFLDVMLGDRPPLTPVETFYQCMLAGDADEALDQAESTLKDGSLCEYCDAVVVKGLQLAANDIWRGVMAAEQVEVVKDTCASLLRDLATRDDANALPPGAETADKDHAQPANAAPPPAEPTMIVAREQLPAEWQGEAPVVCIAGRGPLDDAAAVMLAHVLATRGLPAKAVPYDAASRANIDAFDASGVAMICLCYLEISGTPSHLRFLLRRLRRRIPRVPVLIGFWAADDPVLTDERVHATIGADHYTTSLSDSVSACLEAAVPAQQQAGAAPSPPTSVAAAAPV